MSDQKININLDAIEEVAKLGVRRAAVFMGLGLNAAYDDNLRNYEFTEITQIQSVTPNADDKTIAHYKKEFELWIIMCGLRELIETFAVFLDGIQNACLLMAMHQGRILYEKTKKYRRNFLHKGIKDKLQLLEEKFNVKTQKNEYLISIHHARNCLTHRRGVVGKEDCADNDALIIKWIDIDIYAEQPSGEIIPLDPPLPKERVRLEVGGKIKAKRAERMLSFKKDTRITLSPRNLAEICNLILWHPMILKGRLLTMRNPSV
jgi:hypothetical protein